MSAPAASADLKGTGTMRTSVYLLTIGSCLVLSWLFAARENWIGLALVLVGAVAYAVRLVTVNRTERRRALAQAGGSRASTSSVEQRELRSEIAQMRNAYERNRRTMLLIAVLVAGLAAVAWGWNPAFALALLLFAIPFVVLAWRSARAVHRIDTKIAPLR